MDIIFVEGKTLYLTQRLLCTKTIGNPSKGLT